MGTKWSKNGENIEQWPQIPFFRHFGAILSPFRGIGLFFRPIFPVFGFRPVFHSIPGGLTRKPPLPLICLRVISAQHAKVWAHRRVWSGCCTSLDAWKSTRAEAAVLPLVQPSSVNFDCETPGLETGNPGFSSDPRGPCETSRCLAAKIDSPLSRSNFWLSIALATKLSLKMPPKLPLSRSRGHFFLFQNCPRGEGNCTAIERRELSRGNFCLTASRCLSGPFPPLKPLPKISKDPPLPVRDYIGVYSTMERPVLGGGMGVLGEGSGWQFMKTRGFLTRGFNQWISG